MLLLAVLLLCAVAAVAVAGGMLGAVLAITLISAWTG